MNPTYELVVLFDPHLQDEEYPALIERLKALVARRGGEVTQVDTWGRRRMAYPIAKKVEAYYVVVSFTGQPTEASLTEMTRTLRLNDNVMRVMLTRLPDLSKKEQKAQDRMERKAEKASSKKVVTGSAGDAGAAAQ